MFVYVGGVPGSGKTSLISACTYIAITKGLAWEHTVGTLIMCELAGVATVEELRRLPESARSALRPIMNERIYYQDRLDPYTVRICDGHFYFYDVTGNEHGTRSIQPGDPEQMKGFILIKASSKNILERRIRDKSHRSDRQLNKELIQQEIKMEEAIAKQQAEKLNIPLLFVENNDQDIKMASQRLFNTIRQLIS